MRILPLFIILTFIAATVDDTQQETLTPTVGQVIKHEAYTVSYSEEHEQAIWVSYTLTREMLVKNVKRKSGFTYDPMVKTKSANSKTYTRSGYDRGHLCPSADMAYSKTYMKESFYTSNISPQKPKFNRGIWKKLETEVRKWADRDGKLYIATAGILRKGLSKIGEKGKEQISIPTYFYKVVLDLEHSRAIGFIMPNKEYKGSIMNFAVTVDSVEAVTGLDFYSALEDGLEERIESSLDTLVWQRF